MRGPSIYNAPTMKYAVIVALALNVGAPSLSAQTSGVGEVHFANSGAPAAQQPFLDGLAQLHNFEYPAAE